MRKHYDCGIDLGTTNSCIAIPNDDNTCTVINNDDQRPVTPSVVWINKTGRITVGHRAAMCLKKGQVRKEFKRDMGTDTVYEFEGSGLKKTPVELSAEVLKSVRADAERRRMGEEIRDAVITIPAAFTTVQAEATKEAAGLAGFRHVLLLQEPIAAAVAYGARPDAKDQNWLVVDYGGGTLDVAVISTEDGRLMTVNNKGHNRMGGKDLDRLLYEKIILPKLQADYAISEKSKSATRALIMEQVESCKMALSRGEEACFEIEGVEDDNGEEMECSLVITREAYNQAIRETLKKTVEIAKEALEGAPEKKRKLNKIILVGGSSATPYLWELIREAFPGVELNCEEDPMTVVARGAALFAACNFINDDTEEEKQGTAEGEEKTAGTEIQLRYDDVVFEKKARLIGRFVNVPEGGISRYRIDCLGDAASEETLRTGEWMNPAGAQKDVIQTQVEIFKEDGENVFRIVAQDAEGKDLALRNPVFRMLHKSFGLKNEAPPLPFHIGVLTTDGEENYIDWLIQKNTGLPVSVTRNYRLTERLDPARENAFHILVYEGEDEYNEDADFLAGDVHVRAKDLPAVLPENAEIEITLEIDESRCMNVRARAVDLDYTLASEQLRKSDENYISYSKKLDDLRRKTDILMQKISELKKEGRDVSGERSRCVQLRREVDAAMENELQHGTDNDRAQQLIEEYSALKKSVQELIRNAKKAEEESRDDLRASRLDRYADEDAQNRFQKLRMQKQQAASPEEKKMLDRRMHRFYWDTVEKSFPYLKECRYPFFRSEPLEVYRNPEKARYWFEQGDAAVASENHGLLRQACNELDYLYQFDSDVEIPELRAGLKSM